MSPRDEGGIHPRHEKDTGRSARTGRGRRAGEGSGPAVPLNERIDALGRAADALETVAPEADVQATREVLDRIDRRRTLSAEHTVIGLFGATGSGKSSLLNVLVGAEISRVAVRRPTTSQPVAAVLGAAGSEPLLDWLEVTERHQLDGTGSALEHAAAPQRGSGRGRRRRDPESGRPPGMVLLDLPDLDSVQPAHRALAERMTALVDVIVWVTDPQKYADAVLHHDFVRPFAGHDAVTVMVLNQSDRLRPEERGAVLDSLAGIVRAEGLTAAPVLATSATTGEGLEELREHLVAIARSREAAAFRQRADLTAAADRLHEVADPAGLPAAADPADVDALAQDLAVAARVDEVATAVGSSYRYRAGNRVGWPPLRWLRRVRPDPLRRWNIGQQRDGQGLERTSLPEPDAASAARASGGVRRFADASSAGGSEPWRAAVRGAARSREPELPEALDQAIARTDLRSRAGSWWWPVLDVLQWLVLLIGVVGLGWLALNMVLALFQLPPPPMPMIEELWIPIPLPTVLVVLSIAAGILLAVLGGAVAVLTGAARQRRARRLLARSVREVAEQLVVDEVEAVLARAAATATDLASAGGREWVERM